MLDKITKEGVSGYLRDLKTDRIKGQYGFGAMKVYVPRQEHLFGECMGEEEGIARLCRGGWYMGRREVGISQWVEMGRR